MDIQLSYINFLCYSNETFIEIYRNPINPICTEQRKKKLSQYPNFIKSSHEEPVGKSCRRDCFGVIRQRVSNNLGCAVSVTASVSKIFWVKYEQSFSQGSSSSVRRNIQVAIGHGSQHLSAIASVSEKSSIALILLYKVWSKKYDC